MKRVSERDALKDLSRFLRDMYCWKSNTPEWAAGMIGTDDEVIGVTRHTIKAMRRCVDAVLDSMQNGTPINVMDGYNGVYEQLVGQLGRNGK